MPAGASSVDYYGQDFTPTRMRSLSKVVHKTWNRDICITGRRQRQNSISEERKKNDYSYCHVWSAEQSVQASRTCSSENEPGNNGRAITGVRSARHNTQRSVYSHVLVPKALGEDSLHHGLQGRGVHRPVAQTCIVFTAEEANDERTRCTSHVPTDPPIPTNRRPGRRDGGQGCRWVCGGWVGGMAVSCLLLCPCT